MAKKSRMRLESKFPEVKRANRDAVKKAIQLAVNVGEGEAEKRLERIDDSRGYELPIDVKSEARDDDGRILYEPFYGIFFEYGTPTIPAASFMRPGHRKMKKAFLDDLPGIVDGFIGRRARVR
jgi:hypothetical protein